MGPLISLHVLLSESSSATALTWLEVLPGFSCQGQTRDRLWRQVPCCNSNSWKLAFRGPGPFFLCLCLIWLEAYLLLVAALPCFRQGLLCFVCMTSHKKTPPSTPVLPLEGLRGAASAGLGSFSLQQPPWAGCRLIFLAYLLELLMLWSWLLSC